MSTQTEFVTSVENEFTYVGEIEQLPNLACIGEATRVGRIFPAKPGKRYHTIQIMLEGLYGSKSASADLRYDPEWLNPRFNPGEFIRGLIAAKESPFMITKNLVRADGSNGTARSCVLDGVTGRYYGTVLATLRQVTDPNDPELVANVLREFLATYGPIVTGYELSQKTDMDGKLTKFYEVKDWWKPFDPATGEINVKQFERMEKRVERAIKEAAAAEAKTREVAIREGTDLNLVATVLPKFEIGYNAALVPSSVSVG